MDLLLKVACFVVFVSALVLGGGARNYYWRVQWSARENLGLKYRFGQLVDRGRSVSAFVLRFAAPAGVRLCVRRENWFDRLGKALRIAVEPQLGDRDFDARFHIDCEDPQLLAQLQGQAGLRNLVRRLEIGLRARDAKLRELRWDNGPLDVDIDCQRVDSQMRREAEALEWLQARAVSCAQ